MTKKYQVGDKFWYVPRNIWAPQREVTVASVGRKWIHFYCSMRAEIDTLEVDGGEYSPPGSLFESEADYKEYVRLRLAWADFKLSIDRAYHCPPSMTVEKIAQMTAMIGD